MQIPTIQFALGIVTTIGTILFSVVRLYTTLTEKITILETKLLHTIKETEETMSTLEVIRQDITDIKSYQTEIRVMLFGNNGNNGMNSNIKSLSSDMRDLRESLAILTTLVKNT